MPRITSGPAITAAISHLEAVNQSFDKPRAFLRQRAEDHKAAVVTAEGEFYREPTEARLQHWLEQIAKDTEAHSTATTVGVIIEKRHKDALLDRGATLSDRGPALVRAAALEAQEKLWGIEAFLKKSGSTTASLQRIANRRKSLDGILEKGASNPEWAINELIRIIAED